MLVKRKTQYLNEARKVVKAFRALGGKPDVFFSGCFRNPDYEEEGRYTDNAPRQVKSLLSGEQIEFINYACKSIPSETSSVYIVTCDIS